MRVIKLLTEIEILQIDTDLLLYRRASAICQIASEGTAGNQEMNTGTTGRGP